MSMLARIIGNFWVRKNVTLSSRKGLYLPCFPHTRKSPNIPSFPLFVRFVSTQGRLPVEGDLALLNDFWHDDPHTVGWDRESHPVGGRIEFGINSGDLGDAHQDAMQGHH